HISSPLYFLSLPLFLSFFLPVLSPTSLNVKFNPLKRKRVLEKLKKDGSQVAFLQRHICQKGTTEKRINNVVITVANVYIPPELGEGILICGGGWNTILNFSLDTTSCKRQKTYRSKDLNILMKGTGLYPQ
uniref:Uncharacterized protein n=1 Tax=Oreochromis niloticus TaxID=8128 RepID=A0A669D2E2_ORENI